MCELGTPEGVHSGVHRRAAVCGYRLRETLDSQAATPPQPSASPLALGGGARAVGAELGLRCPAGARVADSTGEVTHTQLPPHLPRPGAGMRGSCHVIRDTFPGSPRPDSQRPRRDGPDSWASPSPSACPWPCHKATCLCLHLYYPLPAAPKDSRARNSRALGPNCPKPLQPRWVRRSGGSGREQSRLGHIPALLGGKCKAGGSGG